MPMPNTANSLPPSEKSTGLTPRSLLFACFLAYALLGALLLLRPHQETFIGLDSSAIRMMTHALGSGRDLTGTDQTLLRVPSNLRHHFLYVPDPGQRMTRDRSFQLDDLESCTYRPWFYPFLSSAALAFDWLVPGPAADYFLPALTWLFFLQAGIFMARKTGPPGLFTALGLIVGLPLIPFFARGYYPELAGLLIILMVTMLWLRNQAQAGHLYPSAFFLGLAVCFHPLVTLWSGAVFLLMISDGQIKTRRVFLAGCTFVLGLLPLVVVTQQITRPYGDIFNPQWLAAVYQANTLYALLLLAAAAGLLVLLPSFFRAGRTWMQTLIFAPDGGAHALRLLLATIPTGLLLVLEQTRTATIEGLTDLWSVLATPYGLAVAATLLASFLPSVRPRSRVLLVTCIALASVYLYLKGIEPFGLWSQRRLMLILLPCVVAALAIWRDVLLAHGHKFWISFALPSATVAICAAMFHQHAPFYLLRAEYGADAVVQELVHATQEFLTIYDYHQYGSPLAALNQPGTLALSNRISDAARLEVIQWAVAESRTRKVIWVTTFANPGLEQDVSLQEILKIRQNLPRLHAKRAFPAEVRSHHLELRILQFRSDSGLPPSVLDIILDKSSLALRGPWGRSDITLQSPQGERLPARWTREGSAFIGPLPAPGGSLRIELTAGAYRRGEPDHQLLIITPPWEGPALELWIGNPHTATTGYLKRPAQARVPLEATGQYTITSRHPYNPSLHGIRGFDPDLGALLHRVRMEVVSHE